MAKLRRNAPCPCESGIKYKKCCGDPLKSATTKQGIDQASLALALRKTQAQKKIREQQQGLGRPIISSSVNGYQMTVVGDSIHHSKSHKFFGDFLSDYIKTVFGEEWGTQELTKPEKDQHPLFAWYCGYCDFQRSYEPQSDGTYFGNATGVYYCYMGLAYNLYLLKHNIELQERFVERLRDRKNFQGAYYELIVANCLIRAGFELILEDETDQSAKHCEFAAISKTSRKKYWVEAKMRGVRGFLGKTSSDGQATTAKPTSKLSHHLRQSFEKPAENERLIFVDVNAVPQDVRHLKNEEQIPGIENSMTAWMRAAAKQLDAKEKELAEGHVAYVFVTNFAFHRDLSTEDRNIEFLAHGLGIPDFAKPGLQTLEGAWRAKKKHMDAFKVADAIKSYPNIPSTFDGSLPMSAEGANRRIEIGETYFFDSIGDDGGLGTVMSAIMLEEEKQMALVVRTEKGKNLTFRQPVTDEELTCYRQHPEAYFGEINEPVKQINEPFEFFEFIVEQYLKNPKDLLLQMAKGLPDIKRLKQLDHEELALELATLLTMREFPEVCRHSIPPNPKSAER